MRHLGLITSCHNAQHVRCQPADDGYNFINVLGVNSVSTTILHTEAEESNRTPCPPLGALGGFTDFLPNPDKKGFVFSVNI